MPAVKLERPSIRQVPVTFAVVFLSSTFTLVPPNQIMVRVTLTSIPTYSVQLASLRTTNRLVAYSATHPAGSANSRFRTVNVIVN